MEQAITELAKASPYAVLLVLGFRMFLHMHKTALTEIRAHYDKAIEEIRKAYI